MADPPRVLIRRQVLDIGLLGTEAEGLDLQRRLPDLCGRVLSPALESAFARVDPGDAHLVLDRLVIDLSDLSLERIEEDLPGALQRGVEDALLDAAPRPSSAAGQTASDPPAAARRRTGAETVDEALVSFLRTGRLPWSFSVRSGSTFEAMVLDAWSSVDGSRGPPTLSPTRVRTLLAESHVRLRLAQQFTPAFVLLLLRHASPDVASAVEDCLAVLDRARQSAPAGVAFARAVRDQAMVAIATGTRPTPVELAGPAWSALPLAHREDTGLVAALRQRWPEVAPTPGPTTSGPDAAERDLPAASRAATGSAPVDLGDDADGIVVEHAGLVLLHPFLVRFFEGLGVASAGELTDPGRALCLLHHLVTGDLTAPEHQLTLAKVLCDVGLDDPVEADVGLTPAEADEATALLLAAIGHWEALRSTSPAALRSEFLVRPGLLSVAADGDWLLRVEARTVDILLDQLPWGLSMIRLPWMGRLLRVEWR